MKSSPHSFHIPVMGTGYSIDTPLKVARFGITSTISLVDHFLIGKIRKFYSQQFGEEFFEIPKGNPDARALEIKEYLNLVKRIVKSQIDEIRGEDFEKGGSLDQYFEMLPEGSPLKERYQRMLAIQIPEEKSRIQLFLKRQIIPGAIDVNIMTKLDRASYRNGSAQGHEFSDALSALRGFAESDLCSAMVFSARINLSLFSYLENFDDFYVNQEGESHKHIILKVSDYRSAFIQGKLFAKKGLWVSEFRIESGLNCGGHVFPTQGVLLGPVLDEFKSRKREFVDSLFDVFQESLWQKKGVLVEEPPPLRLTAQGGICSAGDDLLLRKYFQLEGTGWATPFLVVPEVTAVDSQTLRLLLNASKDDLYLSDASPLGIPFRNLRNSPRQQQMMQQQARGELGAVCRGKFLALDTKFCKEGLCPASRKYQLSLKDSGEKCSCSKRNPSFMEKECICTGLGDSALLKYGIPAGERPLAASICPAPSIIYFKRIFSLREMVDHIYGRRNLLDGREKFSNLFITELRLYIDFLKEKVINVIQKMDKKSFAYFSEFKKTLLLGIEYYRKEVQRWSSELLDKETFLSELQLLENELRGFDLLPCPEVLKIA
ncbi:MAG TPA: hypothetical protein PK590_03840 [Candidatus Omnitrophota bacterium]|nr:hypothetical protein [Candidatus Omnitrophota bacterium]